VISWPTKQQQSVLILVHLWLTCIY